MKKRIAMLIVFVIVGSGYLSGCVSIPSNDKDEEESDEVLEVAVY